MEKEFVINPCSGMAMDVMAGQIIVVEDIEGGQVVDFFAERKGDHGEFLSPGVTIDCNESLKLHVGDTMYSNLYNPMFSVLSDDVGEHDLIHPCCRQEMYDFFYKNGKGHPNCLDNINGSLGTSHPIIHPVNLFMNMEILENGGIRVKKPLSKAGDCITLKALMNVRIGIAACSVSESDCNSGRCTAIRIIVKE